MNRTTNKMEDIKPINDRSLSPPLAPKSKASDPFPSQSFTLTVDQDGGQLSSAPQTNSTIELSIPREIISSSISSSTLHSELLRPITAGTYNGTPAYLLRLQFKLEASCNSQNWLSRFQHASINAIFEDAPITTSVPTARPGGRNRRTAKSDSEAQHPAIVKTFPGDQGWEGPVSTAALSTDKGVGLQAGWNGLGASATLNQSRAREELGAVKVTALRKGKQRNSLLVNVAENAVQMAGIPSFLTIPVIVTHHESRFSMRVALSLKVGVWRGKLAEMVPVLGRADEPLFFDPVVLKEMMEREERGIGGVKVVEWGGELEGVGLQAYSSF